MTRNNRPIQSQSPDTSVQANPSVGFPLPTRLSLLPTVYLYCNSGKADNATDYGSWANNLVHTARCALFHGGGGLRRGGQYTGEFGYDDVIVPTKDTLGDGRFGYSSEFVRMERMAQMAEPSVSPQIVERQFYEYENENRLFVNPSYSNSAL